MVLTSVFRLAKKAALKGTTIVHRPLYKRLFTDRVLDNIYNSTVASLIGASLFLTSYGIVNACIYYKVIKPLRDAERERMEKDLIEADQAGFLISSK